MRISVITPAGRQSRNGNRTTADRWAGHLADLGHEVIVDQIWDGSPADLMVAIHAWRSAASIDAFHQRYPDRPLVVGLGGTDVYRYQHSHPDVTLRSMEIADRLIGLHDAVALDLPERLRSKVSVIVQSAQPVVAGVGSARGDGQAAGLAIAVVATLREVKDPLRAALAVRDLPEHVVIRVTHVGQGDAHWSEVASREMARNPRYEWLGPVSHAQANALIAGCDLLVLSSRSEGGANVVSEAVVAGTPVLASRIPGSVGLLGEDYGGYFEVGDTDGLRTLLCQAHDDRAFVKALRVQVAALAPRFSPDAERRAWQGLMKQLGA